MIKGLGSSVSSFSSWSSSRMILGLQSLGVSGSHVPSSNLFGTWLVTIDGTDRVRTRSTNQWRRGYTERFSETVDYVYVYESSTYQESVLLFCWLSTSLVRTISVLWLVPSVSFRPSLLQGPEFPTINHWFVNFCDAGKTCWVGLGGGWGPDL